MTPTAEQETIAALAATGQDLRVVAGAGAGKSSTLRYTAEQLPRRRIAYVVFNRMNADEAQARFPANTDARSSHSLAFGAVGWRFKGRVQGMRGVTPTPFQDLYHALGIGKLGKFGRTQGQLLRAIIGTVKQFEYSADREIGEQHVPRDYLIGLERPTEPTLFQAQVTKLRDEMVGYFVGNARELWTQMVKQGSALTIRHDTYLKLWQLEGPRINADVIMVDEAQDLNPVTAAIVAAQRAQRIWVGDPFQAIYAWRGAVNALAAIEANTAYLSQSFRWGPAVADVANTILELRGGFPGGLRGDPRQDTVILDRDQACPYPKTLLCRGNAAILVHALKAADDGVKIAVVGSLTEALRLLESAHALWSGDLHGVRAPELAPFTCWDDFRVAAGDDYGLEKIVELVDEHGARIPRMIQRLRENGEVPEEQAQVILTTVHKAKGREWPHVELAKDYQSHALRLRKGEELEPEEVNILYVAATRARRALRLNHAAGDLVQMGRARIRYLLEHGGEDKDDARWR